MSGPVGIRGGSALCAAADQLGATATGAAHAPALLAWIAVAIAVLLATFDLAHRRLPGPVATGVGRVIRPLAAGLEFLHSGAVGDYVAWLVVGLALFTIAFALA